MFDSFKKKSPPPSPYTDRRSFITELFDKIRLRPTPEERLEGQIDLCEIIRNLENEFDVRCFEFEFERDEIRDTFSECSDPKALYTCAIAYGILQDKVRIIDEESFQDLPEHLKARLLRTHILSEIDQENVDPLELDPSLQHAFHEVEKRKLNEFEMKRVLEVEFGIKGWRSVQTMNPHIIYD